jgi:hypothetical protein
MLTESPLEHGGFNLGPAPQPPGHSARQPHGARYSTASAITSGCTGNSHTARRPHWLWSWVNRAREGVRERPPLDV